MPAWQVRMREDWSLAQIEAFFADAPFDFEPGTKWHYDNSGYVLLGAIVEKVTGRPYAGAVADMIFRPLGMGDDALRPRRPDHPRPRGRIPEDARRASSTRRFSR